MMLAYGDKEMDKDYRENCFKKLMNIYKTIDQIFALKSFNN